MFISRRRLGVFYKIWLIIWDALSFYGSVFLAAFIRFDHQKAIEYIRDKDTPLVLSLLFFIVISYLNGLYDFRSFIRYRKIFLTVATSIILGIIVNVFIFYGLFFFAIGRGISILMIFLLFILVLIPRVLYAVTIQMKFLDKRVIIVGNQETIDDAINLIRTNPSTLYNIKGVVVNSKKDKEESFKNCKVLGTIEQIEDIVKKNKIDTIIITSLEPQRQEILKYLRVCRYQGIEIIDIVALYEDLELQVPLKYIDEEWLFSSTGNYRSFYVVRLKRFLDIMWAILGLLLTWPICLIVAILIKLDSKGPVFYRQKRLGRYGQPFRVIKFRSMIHHAERGLNGPVWAKENDNRVTRVGYWLRKTRIDEIPQLINVLLDQMSLVGPRPERPSFVKELSLKIPFYQERLYLQPGLTGWAQINYPYTATIEETKNKLQYDIYYIKHVSLILDSLIILKTLKIVLFGRGR